MERIKFNESEITGQYVEDRFGKSPIFNTPITPLENMRALFNGENPVWMPLTSDCKGITPRIDPDNIARAFVFDGGEPIPEEQYGGKDMFGIEWVYVKQVGGSMVRPGAPLMTDVNDWKKFIKMPDVNSWDWEGCAKMNKEWIEKNKDYVINLTFLNGTMFERLISFMDFEGAALAVIDEEQKDAVKELCNTILEQVYFPYLENIKKWLPEVTMITLHDDWGSQRAPFFSIDVARELFVPILQKFAAKCKELGFMFQLHSCGKNEMLVPAYIEGGVQMWNGMYMNDKRALFEQYGDRFIFGVDPPAIADNMEADLGELEAAAREFCEFYIRDGKCRVVANCMRKNPHFVEFVYKISRQMLNP